MKPGATTSPVASIGPGRGASTVVAGRAADRRPRHPPRPAGRARAVDQRAAGDQQVDRDGHAIPGGPSRRRPLTHAARTMSGCGRNVSRDMTSAGSSESIAGDRRHQPRVDGDHVGLLAGLERPDRVLLPERARPVVGREAQPVERLERRRVVARLAALLREDPQAALDVCPGAHVGEDRELRPRRDVGAQPDADPGRQVARERHRARGEEQVRGRAVGDRRVGLRDAGDLPRREVDRVGEDRLGAEAAGPVVDVEVVDGVGEQPRDLADLVPVLRDVRLPVGAGLAGEVRRQAQHVRPARDGESRRDGVPQPAVVAHVPARAQVGRLAEAGVEHAGGRQRVVVAAAIHHHLADHRPDPVGLGGAERGVQATAGTPRRTAPRSWSPRPRRRGTRAGRGARPPPRRRRVRAGRCSARARSGGQARRRRPRWGAAAGGRGGRPSRA